MRFIIFIYLFILSAESRVESDIKKEKDSFITEKEYAQHLYKNPRGIGCDKCHGKKGEGMIISKYKHNDEELVLRTNEINSLDYEAFAAALEEKRSIMPKYFLTSKEIQALYNYLHNKGK